MTAMPSSGIVGQFLFIGASPDTRAPVYTKEHSANGANGRAIDSMRPPLILLMSSGRGGMFRFFAATFFLSVFSMGIGVRPLMAQLGTATISGVVTDSTGATIAGASIAAVNVETGFRRQTVTNQIGQYNLPG